MLLGGVGGLGQNQHQLVVDSGGAFNCFEGVDVPADMVDGVCVAHFRVIEVN